MCKGVMKCVCGCTVQMHVMCVCVCVCFCASFEGCRGEQTGPPQFSLSIILHARHTHSDMPERVSISSVCQCVCVCVCVCVLLCLPKECSSLYLYVCLGYYIHSLHTCAQRQMEPEGWSGTLSSTVKIPRQAQTVWAHDDSQ